MKIEERVVRGDMKVSEPYALKGLAAGHVEVEEGGDLQLFGTCASGLTVHPGGRAVVYGFVAGDVVNKGGELHIFGVVTGALREEGGSTNVDEGAVIALGWAA